MSLLSGVHAAVTTACSKHESKTVFAAGWGVASLTLLHVAGVEPLKGAVCLGLPLTKKHRPLRNVIGDIKCPVLFIIGTASRWCSTVDVENLVSNIPGDKRVIFIEGMYCRVKRVIFIEGMPSGVFKLCLAYFDLTCK